MRVVLYPDPILLQPAERIADVTGEIREQALAMIDVMQLERGVGLAAPQVGWGARLLLASPDGERESTVVCINPEITWRGGGTEWGEEGCLSFPGIYGDVLRHLEIKLKARDLEGEEVELHAQGFFARVLQHEMDHLDGIVFISKMRPADRTSSKREIEELVRRFEAAGGETLGKP